MKANYYDILGVTPNSELSDIKSSYRRLARKYHPDVNPEYIDKFKEINEAYSTLSDEKKRMKYDMIFGFYKSGKAKSEKSSPNSEQNSASSAKQTEKKAEQKKKETKTDKKFFDDLFSTKSDKPEPKKGTDITAEVVVSLQEAVNGTTKSVNVLNTEVCPRCKGRKFINGGYCTDCSGTGEITHERRLKVNIPAGIKNLTKLRLRGEGNIGSNGGKNGDLYLIVKIEGNSSVKFSGKTMLYDLPIQPYEAVLGASIKINTLYGELYVKIPPKTKSGQKFSIKQNVNGNENEIIVTVHIEIPTFLSDDETKLYEKLKRISSNDIRENSFNV